MVNIQDDMDHFVPMANMMAKNRNRVSKLIFFILLSQPYVVRLF